MSLSDMTVFNNFLYTTMTETLDQQINLFNAATNGAITLSTVRNVGDYSHEAFYKAFATQYRRRDPYSTGAVAAQDLSQGDMVGVKVAGANGPFAFDPGQFRWIQRNQEEAGVAIGEQVAAAIMQDQLNTSIAAVAAAILNNTLSFDGSAGTMTLTALNSGSALFGDAAQRIVCWVMHSKPYHDLLGAAITNSNQIFEFGTLRVVTDNVGRPIVVSDVPGLFNATPDPDQYTTVGLVPSGIMVEDNDDYFSNLELSNGDENINATWQSEYSYNLKLKGYAWDVTNGGKAPTDAELVTGTNWDKVATYDKDTAGVSVVTR